MAKYDYIANLVDGLEEAQLREMVKEYAKKNKAFEAFLIDKSGKVVDTGKSFGDYEEELGSLMKKCQTRRGFFKVTRLNNAGLSSFNKSLEAHFSNANYVTSCWMSLALMNMLHQVILANTRYRSAPKPFKVFEKIMLEARDRLDSSLKFFQPSREDRKHLFATLVACWWREQLRDYEQTYFSTEDLFQYAERDEDFLALQIALRDLEPEARQLETKRSKLASSWKKLLGDQIFGNGPQLNLTQQLSQLIQKAEERLNDWN